MTARQSPSRAEQDQRDTITRMDVTITDVLLPSLKRVEENVLGITNKDLISRQEADAKYVTKADFKPYAVALSVIALGVVGGLVTAFLKVVLK